MRNAAYEFLLFGLKEAQACVFAGSFFVILLLSKYVPLGTLPRYDFIFLAAILLQVGLLALRIETLAEAAVLCLFHAIGLGLELFKTHPAIGSWSYPEPAFFKIATVPLYSGFMYAAVASYLCQAWRIFDLKLENYPSYRVSVPLCIAVYGNFFTNAFMPDLRLILIPLVFVTFWRTRVYFTSWRERRWMPMVISFFLIGFFIWVAENMATFLGAWVYPEQMARWTTVSIQKLSSWFLLVIISFVIVADLKGMRDETVRG